jgi:hypothetical protein
MRTTGVKNAFRNTSHHGLAFRAILADSQEPSAPLPQHGCQLHWGTT